MNQTKRIDAELKKIGVRLPVQTANCVRCFKPAKQWGGYVLQGKRRVIAGWCSDRCQTSPGFVGIYLVAMGSLR